MERENDHNKAILSGTVVSPLEIDHVLYGEKFYSTKISVPRLSENVDILPITIPERICPVLPEVGDMIHVTGQLRSYNKHLGSRSKLVLTVFCHTLEFLYANEPCENSIEIVGYICKEAIFRTTPFLREICDIIVAVNRSYNKSDYLPCIAWGRNAVFAKTLPVGSLVKIKGRFQSREYVKKLENIGEEVRTAYEISCSILEEE